MSFDDLPHDWPERPLTDPRLLADVLDLVVTSRSRDRGALYVLLCDDADRLLQPIAVDDVPPAPEPAECDRVLQAVLGPVADLVPHGSFLVAVARPGGLSVTPADDGWAESARRVRGPWRLLGVHVVTADGSRPVPLTVPAG